MGISPKENPWEPQYPRAMLSAIVGFEIEVEDIQAKFKLSQNRPEIDRKNVIRRLIETGAEGSLGVDNLIKENEF